MHDYGQDRREITQQGIVNFHYYAGGIRIITPLARLTWRVFLFCTMIGDMLTPLKVAITVEILGVAWMILGFLPREAALYVDSPKYPQALGVALNHLINSPDYYKNFVVQGLTKVVEFLWQKAGGVTIDKISKIGYYRGRNNPGGKSIWKVLGTTA